MHLAADVSHLTFPNQFISIASVDNRFEFVPGEDEYWFFKRFETMPVIWCLRAGRSRTRYNDVMAPNLHLIRAKYFLSSLEISGEGAAVFGPEVVLGWWSLKSRVSGGV